MKIHLGIVNEIFPMGLVLRGQLKMDRVRHSVPLAIFHTILLFSRQDIHVDSFDNWNAGVRNPTPERAGACRDGVASARLFCQLT